MSKEISVSTALKGDVHVISIGGDVTAVTGEQIEEAYRQADGEGTKKVLLFFDGENYINSGGIAILIGIAAESRQKAQTIRMTGLSDHFQKIFSMVGLTKYAAIYPSEKDALDGF
jgi:anti-anti-sigma factor